MENSDPNKNKDSVRPKDPSRKKKSPHKNKKFLKVPPGFKELPPPAFGELFPPSVNEVPPPAADELPPPTFQELSSSDIGVIPPYREPPSYEELHLNGGRNAESDLRQEFVSPQVKYWRKNLLLYLTCARCLRLYDSSRKPLLITAGTSACAECASQLIGEGLVKTFQYFPSNTGFVSAVHELLNSQKLFHMDEPFCSELDRGIIKDSSCKKTNTLYWDLRQKALHQRECMKHLTHLIFCNEVNHSSLLTALGATYECTNIMLKPAPLDVKALLLLETIDGLDEFRIVFDVKIEEYGDEEEWLLWNKLIETSKSQSINYKLLKSIYICNLDLTLFQDVDDRRFYSKVTATSNTLYIEAFSLSTPFILSRGLGKFVRFDPRALVQITELFFEIKVLGDNDYRPVPYRYHITLINMDVSCQTLYLFLGYKSSGYLGAEIEVTEEKVIFNHYLRNGQPETENIEEAQLGPKAYDLKPVLQGMVVSDSVEALNKISIFKHDDTSKQAFHHIGMLNPANLGALRKLPLGKHKISACGIGVYLYEEENNED